MDTRITGLEARLKNAASLRERIDALNELAEALRFKDRQRARALSEEARDRSYAAEFEGGLYRRGLAFSLYNLSLLEFDVAHYDAAYSLAQAAMAHAVMADDQPIQARILRNVGNTHFYHGNYAHALETWLAALRLCRQTGDRENECALLNNIGVLYNYLDNPADALVNLNESLGLARAIGDVISEAYALDNIGEAYRRMGALNQAVEYGLQALDKYRLTGNKRGQSEVLHSLGRAYLNLKDTDTALQYLEQALQLATETEHQQQRAIVLLALARAHLQRNALEEARCYAQQAADLALALQALQEQYQAHELLAELAERSGDLAQALSHYRQFHALKEQVFNEQTDRRLKGLQVVHNIEMARREAEIQQLRTVELQRQIDEKERLIAELDAYAHTVAHDLKNPLSLLIGHLELLSESLSDHPDPDIAESAAVSLRTSYRLYTIVDELLLLASVRQQDVTVAPLDMAAVVEAARKDLGRLITEYGAMIATPRRWPAALGHAAWVERVWANLISNAIKYGGRPPQVWLGATRQPDGMIRCWVRDNGDGISPEAHSQLFDKFSRPGNSQAKGHGLGLSIVRRIVEKLGGQVGVESTGRPGEGATFYFTLPAAKQRSVRRAGSG